MKIKTRISVAGTGFVGLITAAVFADRGFEATALDVDKSKIEKVNKGETFFFEPNLEPLLKRVVLEKKALKATDSSIEAIKASDVTFICVGTPSQPDGSCDLKYIQKVAADIGKAIAEKNSYHLVVVKSTVVPETTRMIVKPILEESSGKVIGQDFGLCMNPEFLQEGKSVHDSIFPDRVIIGEFDTKSGDVLEQLFRELYSAEKDEYAKHWEGIFTKELSCPEVLRFSLETAECIKYANNTFLATKISFINEFANICEQIPGVDISNIAKGIGLDYRINPRFLRAGTGFGGSCLPKDVNAIIHFANSKNYKPELLTSVLIINKQQAKHMVELAKEKLGTLKDKTVAILGLSFKPETDDMRNAPSLQIVDDLLSKGAKVVAWDPIAMEEARKDHWIGEKITYAESLAKAIEGADVCLLLTEWKLFRELQPQDFKTMKKPILIDGRRIYEHELFLKEGVDYTGIGLGL